MRRVVAGQFWVGGKPEAKGSWRVVPNKRTGKSQLIPHNKGEPGWAKAVAWRAKSIMKGAKPFDGPCRLTVWLYLEKPKKPSHPYPVRPDGDKALRSVCDALSGIVYADDKQVVDMRVTKEWAGAQGPGALVSFDRFQCSNDDECDCCDCVADRSGV